MRIICSVVMLPLRIVGLLFRIPWAWYYFSYRWRYRVTPKQSKAFFDRINSLVRYMGGPSDFINVKGIVARQFWWFMVNGVLKHIYKFLKQGHCIAEEDSNMAKDVYVKIVPMLFSNLKDIAGGTEELRHVNSSKFMARSTDHFMECRGNVFTPAYVAFIEIMITVREGAVRAMKIAYAYAADRIVKKLVFPPHGKQLVDNVMEFQLHFLDLATKAPEALREGLAAYADNLARTALLYNDAQAANYATLASQSMIALRTTVASRRFSDKDRRELDSYFANMRLAGAAIYNHLQKPLALPPPPPSLPPTATEAAAMTRIAALEKKLDRLEKANAKSRETLPAVKERLQEVVRDWTGGSGANRNEPKYDDGEIAISRKKPDCTWKGKKRSELNFQRPQGREGHRFRVWNNEYDFNGDKMRLTAKKQVEYMDHLLRQFMDNKDPMKPIKPLYSNSKSIFKGECAEWFSRHVRPYRDGRNKCNGTVIFSLDKLPPKPSRG